MNRAFEFRTKADEEVLLLKAELEHERGYRKLLQSLDNMPDGMMYRSVRDINTGALRFDYVSGTCEKLLGVPAEVVLDDIQNLFTNIEPEDLKIMMQRIYASLDPLKKFDTEARYRHPVTKTEHWLQISSYPRREGDAIYADGFIFDITARKQAEQKLIIEKERLEKLGDNLPDGVLYQFVFNMLTNQIRFSFVSGRWEEITGISIEAVMSNIDIFFAMIYPDDLPALMQEIDRSIEKMDNFYVEFRINVHGKTRWIQMSSHTSRRDTKVFLDGIMLDITHHKEVKRELELERNRLQMLINNIPNGTFYQFLLNTRTNQMIISYVNATWEAVTGIDADISVGEFEKVLDKVHPDDLLALMQSIKDSARTMTDHIIEIRLNNRWVSIVARPRHDGTFIIWDGILTNINDRKETERELKAINNRLQALGDNIPGGTLHQFVRDTRTRQMRMSYVSATWEAVTGIPVEDALEDITKAFAVIPSDDFLTLLQTINKSAQTMNDINLEIRFGNRWIHIVSRPSIEGSQVVWNGIIIDITERKKIEAELTKYREELEHLVEERTADLDIALKEIQASNEELFATNEELYATNEELNDKNVQLAEEITARMGTMKQLEESENKMKSFFAQSSEGVIVTDNEGRVVEWNQQQESITGIRYKKAIGEYCWDLYRKTIPQKNGNERVEEFRKLVLSVIELARKGEKRTNGLEVEILQPDKSSKFVLATIFPIKYGDQYYSGQIVHDITHQKLIDKELDDYRTQLENMVEQRTKELLLAKEKAEESDKLKSAFLANMSHEIRTPLNGIVGFLRFICSNDLSPERRQEYINIVNNSSMQLAKIIDDIIDVSKIEANLMSINPVTMNLNELMNELWVFFETYLQSQNKEHIELILDESGFIDNCIVYMDSTRLRQILTNLISNAIKFTEKGFIRFGYHKSAPDFLEFVVEDSGIGLSDDQQEVIFERFRQAKIANRNRYGGTGLGLTISRSLVEMKGGKMWVESSEGKGSSFYFTVSYLPILTQDGEIFTGTQDDKPSEKKSFTDKSVLFVEPITMKFKYYQKLVSATGATVVCAKSLKQWEEMVQTAIPFDIVIAEASLFDYEDYNNISRIKKIRPNLPIILVVSDKKREKYIRLVRNKLCNAAVEVPVVYGDVLKILGKYAK